MACGLYPGKGHTMHFCSDCQDIGRSCENTCRLGNSCNFKPVKLTPEEDAVRAYRAAVLVCKN